MDGQENCGSEFGTCKSCDPVTCLIAVIMFNCSHHAAQVVKETDAWGNWPYLCIQILVVGCVMNRNGGATMAVFGFLEACDYVETTHDYMETITLIKRFISVKFLKKRVQL